MPAHRVARGSGGGEGALLGTTYTIIDCSAYGSRLRLKTICCSVAQFAQFSIIEITDGTTTHFKWHVGDDGTKKQPPCLNFPDGYDWGDGCDVLFKVPDDCIARCVVVAEVRG